jgi:hypothetical protein
VGVGGGGGGGGGWRGGGGGYIQMYSYFPFFSSYKYSSTFHQHTLDSMYHYIFLTERLSILFFSNAHVADWRTTVRLRNGRAQALAHHTLDHLYPDPALTKHT